MSGEDVQNNRRLKRYESCSVRHFSKWRFYLYLFMLRFICAPLIVLAYRPKVYGRDNVIKSGSFIVVSNHVDTFDPILVSYSVNYPIAYMAKKELFRNFWIAELYRSLGGFALDREHPNNASLKTALNVLKSQAKWALGMFPEGTRSRDGRLLPMKKGVGSIAKKTGLPILPIGINKSSAGEFVITIGKPVTDVSDAEAVHRKIQETLAHLVDLSWDRAPLEACHYG